MKNYRKVMGFITIIILVSFLGCLRPQHFEQINGRWVITQFSQFSFSPLHSSWEPHPPPTDNCAIFYGKKGTGTHISVFLHDLPADKKPIDIIKAYMEDDPVSNRTVVEPIMAYGNEGYIAACENNFKNLGAEVRAIEYFAVIPTSSSIVIGCIFKKKLEVHSHDFRREEEAKVTENIAGLVGELNEFLSFCNSFREEE